MNWKRWRMGLLVSALTGACTAFGVGLIVPGISYREGLYIALASMAKDILLYLKTHPVDSGSEEQNAPEKNS